MVDNINTNTMVGKVVAVCIALLFIVVLAFPIANSLSNMGGNGGGSGAVGSATPITYTNEGQYYYADYDKAVADAMPFTVSVVKDETTYADVTVGDYSFRTPAHKSNLSEGDTDMNDAVFTIPILQVNGHFVDSENTEYSYDISYVYAIVGQYNVLGNYVIGNMEVTYLLYGGGAEEISTYTWNDVDFDDVWFSTLGELLDNDESYTYGIEYTSMRVISQEGEYVYAKNPIVSDISDVLSFNLYYKTYSTYSANTYNYYTMVVGAKGTFSYNEYAQLGKYSMTNSNQLVPKYYNNITTTLNTSNIDDNLRLDGFSISYVGSSDSYAYLGFCDAYAIVPKTVEYSLASGSNADNVQAFMKYYESAPNTHIDISYTIENKDISLEGQTISFTSMNTLTLSFNGKSIVYDISSELNEFYEKVKTSASPDDSQELFEKVHQRATIPILINPPVAVNMSSGANYVGMVYVNMVVLTNSEQFEEIVSFNTPNSIDISSNSAISHYQSRDRTTALSGYCYMIDSEGEYGCFTPAQLTNGVYVTSDILDFDGAIMGEDMRLGFSWISGRESASSVYETHPIVQDTYHLVIEDGKLKDIGWVGGYDLTGNNPRVEVGEITAEFVVLPIGADNGGSGGDDSGTGTNVDGVASTLIKLVPILLIIGLLMTFIVPMVYKPN